MFYKQSALHYFILVFAFLLLSIFPTIVAAQDMQQENQEDLQPEQITNEQNQLESSLIPPIPPIQKTNKETPLLRAGILSIGVFPFSMVYTGFVMDIVRFAAHNFDIAYAPWPFRTQNSVQYTNGENWLKLGISAGISLVFGFISALIK